MKKKSIFAASALVALAACTSEDLVVSPGTGQTVLGDQVMSFAVKNKNMTRAASMESQGMYNFGVWAVKQSGAAAPYDYQDVMNNYLVGYHGAGVGYAYDETKLTYGTSGNLTDGISQWVYEGLGNAEYLNNPDAENGYYIWNPEGTPTVTDPDHTAFMSNNANQYLKYWDYSSNKVDFYAYAPYVKGAKTPSYAAGKLTIPDFGAAPFMVATTSVPKASYAYDVPLTFKRLGAVVRVKFWEDIPGYDVEMIDYKLTVGSDTYKGAVAQGNIVSGAGKEFVYNYEGDDAGKGDFTSTVTASATTLEFAIPTGAQVTNVPANTIVTGQTEYNKIGESKDAASASATEYNATPSGGRNGDLTFHVSFRLRSLDSKEIIEVTNATATVIDDYTDWNINTVYTYIFRITKDANGATGGDTDPKGLYPIVFDDIQIADYDTEESEWIVSQVAMSRQLLTLTVPNSYNIDANLNYEDKTGLNYTFTWISSNTNVATVEETTASKTDGYKEANMKSTATISAVAAGTAIITATNNGHSATCRVTVPLAIAAVGIPSITAGTAGTFKLKANAPSGQTVTWDCDYTGTTYTPTSKETTAAGEMEFSIPNTTKAGDVITVTATYTDATGYVHTDTYTVTVVAP